MEYIDKIFININKIHKFLDEKFGEDDKNIIIRNTKKILEKKEKEQEIIEVKHKNKELIVNINEKTEEEKKKILEGEIEKSITKLHDKRDIINNMLITSKKRENESYKDFMECLHKSKQTKVKRIIEENKIEAKIHLKAYKIHKNRKIKNYQQLTKIVRDVDTLRQTYCDAMDIRELDNEIISLSNNYGDIKNIRVKIDAITELQIDNNEFSADLANAFTEREEDIETYHNDLIKSDDDELDEYMEEYEELYGIKEIKETKEKKEENIMKKFDESILNIEIPLFDEFVFDVPEEKQDNNKKIKTKEYM